MNHLYIPLLAVLILPVSNGLANRLQHAIIDKIVNDVRAVDSAARSHPAHVEGCFKEGSGVRTGVQSRAELRLQDNTLTRSGAETLFSSKKILTDEFGTRNDAPASSEEVGRSTDPRSVDNCLSHGQHDLGGVHSGPELYK